MKTLGRYIILEILKLLIPIWLGLGALLFALEWLAQVFQIRASAWDIFKLYALKAPSHLSLVFPVAALFSTLAVYGQMNRNMELVAAQAMGYSKRKLVMIAGLAVAIATLPYYLVNSFIGPLGMREHLIFFDEGIYRRASSLFSVKQQKIWYKNKDVLYNVDFFDTSQNELYGVTIYTFDEDFHLAQIIYAKKAVYLGPQQGWNLIDGYVNLVDKAFLTPQRRTFESRQTFLLEAPSTLKRVDYNPLAMTTPELKRSIEHHKSLGVNTREREVVYHSRFSFLVVSFVFLLIGLPRVMTFSRTGNLPKDIMFVVMISMLYWFAYTVGMSLGNKGKVSPVLAAWGPTLLFALAGLRVLWKK